MNLFEFCVNLHQKKNEKGWCETTAVFTGNYEKAVIQTRGGFVTADYNSYEIRYTVNGKERRGFYSFHPLPDPDAADIKDSEMRIRYKKRKPYIFEQILN